MERYTKEQILEAFNKGFNNITDLGDYLKCGPQLAKYYAMKYGLADKLVRKRKKHMIY